MGNTFYFVYMFLKYVFPQLAPPTIVLESLGSDTSNVYSSLIAPVIDSGGSFLLLIMITFLYACWIGMCLVLANNWFVRKRTIAALCFYANVFSCVIRSFYNPTFSYSDIVFGAFYSVIILVITQTARKKGGLVIQL